MSGYMMVHGECYSCHAPLAFNATHVPSLPVDGVRQPICRSCIERANPRRIANGLQPVVIHPDAYEPEEVQ